MTEVSRDLKASSKKPRARSDDSDESDSEDEADDDDVLDEAGIFNYDKWNGTTPVYYEPNLGDDSFTHDGHYFQFKKDSQENKYAERIEYFLVLRCMGRSTQPIKELINHVKEWSSTKPNSMTDIYRAEAKHGGYWQCQTTRPSRHINTVTLDAAQKDKVVADINEYLHPATARWYAARGIPHRRGYLFHGPPGTGKTSLSFAVAGIFGLSIYCASLSERDMGESDLASLFSQLPSRCVVLLEDIDSAGIRREKSAGNADSDSDSDSDDEAEKKPKKPQELNSENKSEEKPDEIKLEKSKSLRRRLTRVLRTPKSPKSDSETTTLVASDGASDVAPPSTTKSEPSVKAKTSTKADSSDEGSKSKISLAGLLNIIDGAASNEVSLSHDPIAFPSLTLHLGPCFDHDNQLPRETRLGPDPPRPRGPANQIHARDPRSDAGDLPAHVQQRGGREEAQGGCEGEEEAIAYWDKNSTDNETELHHTTS
jgi:chaperone BCS1